MIMYKISFSRECPSNPNQNKTTPPLPSPPPSANKPHSVHLKRPAPRQKRKKNPLAQCPQARDTTAPLKKAIGKMDIFAILLASCGASVARARATRAPF